MALVERESKELPLTQQAELLTVSRSSLYYQPREPSAEEIAIKHRIDELYTQCPFYGSRKIEAQRRSRRSGDQSKNGATTYARNGRCGCVSRAEFESTTTQTARISVSLT